MDGLLGKAKQEHMIRWGEDCCHVYDVIELYFSVQQIKVTHFLVKAMVRNEFEQQAFEQ